MDVGPVELLIVLAVVLLLFGSKKLPELPKAARVLTFCYDTGERYLSVEGLFPLPD